MIDKPERLAAALASARRIVAGPLVRDAKLRAVCDALHRRVLTYDWVGFYLLDEDGRELALSKFAGEPTRHVRIALGRGVCGRAAQQGRTVVVDDVGREANYLCCSAAVQSEIVVPICTAAGRLVGVLDIDSHTPAAFDESDRSTIEAVCRAVAGLFDA